MGRAWGLLCLLLASGVLGSCSWISGSNLSQPDPRDTKPPTIMDRVRALDISPRTPPPGQVDSPDTPSSAQPEIYPGNGTGTVGQPIVHADAGAGPANANGEGYDLNFENAPVATLAKVILGDILGVGYTIDPRVQGTVSLASGRPVPKSDILFVLENALRLSNVALVRDVSGYRLMPAGEAIGSGSVDRLASAQPGYGITVIPLRYVSAQTIIKLVDGFAAKPGLMRADAARNILILQGSGSERRNALDIAASFDVDWMRGQAIGIFPVKNGTPDPMIVELEKIMDSGEAGLSQGMIKFQPIARMNAILVVSRKAEYLKIAGQWIERLDQSSIAGTNLRVYRLRYGDARKVALLLNDIFVGRGGTGLDTAGSQIAPGAGASASTSSGTSAGGPLAALSFPSQTGGATATATVSGTGIGTGGGAGAGMQATSPLQRTATALGGPGDQGQGGLFGNIAGGDQRGPSGPGVMPGVRITADITNNAVLVYATQEGHRIVQQTLQQIDRPQIQVAIDATIAEVTLNDELSYGVQFFLSGQINSTQGSIFNTLTQIPISPNVPGFNFLLGSQANPHIILDALHTLTNIKVLSNPSLVVLDNQPAILQVGDQVPISTGTATVLTANNTVVNTIDYRNTGIILKVVPRITSNGNVILDVEQEISNVVPGTPATQLTPTISQRRVKSSIAVQSGQTVLLAGLISDTENLTRPGIPLLDELPAIGDFFSHKDDKNMRTELIIFIRPQIIRDAVDANMVAEELRTKMSGRMIGTNNREPVTGTHEGPQVPFPR